MKLDKVTIEGFRGAPTRFDLKLDGKSLCLLGENGQGKTTIVDALEYWSAGGLAGFKSEGCKLDAAINLDHGPPATVICERRGHPTLRRSLTGARSNELEAVGSSASAVSPPPSLPILRHSTMAGFMSQSSGEKKRALLSILGLDDLMVFRDTLVTAANTIRERADQAEDQARKEAGKLDRECEGRPLVNRADELRLQAGLSTPLRSAHDLLKLKVAAAPAVTSRVSRSQLVENALDLSAKLDATAILAWNAVVADRHAKEAEALHELVEVGRRVLQTWDQGTCPLCLRPEDGAHLAGSLATRSVQLAEIDSSLRRARAGLVSHGNTARELAGAIEALVKASPEDKWPHDGELRPLAVRLTKHSEEMTSALADTRECHDLPEGCDLSPFADALRVAASASESPEIAALARLVRLRVLLEGRNEADVSAAARKAAADATCALRDLAEKRVKTTVEAAIGRLGQTVADFYARLVRNPVYTDVSLEYTELRRGGIEFKLTFNGSHTVRPPQRVVSESQLNALGLAFFLARVKIESAPWRTIVLDDVVNSFDADHRMGLARLLSEEFADWQVLLFTHDSVFVATMSQYLSDWRFRQIVAWSPAGGPVIDDADPLQRLKKRLNDGETGADLGGLARVALERALTRPLERLGLPIRYDRRLSHSAREYLDALLTGFAARGSQLKDLPVLKRMKGASYLVNLGAHDRATDPALNSADLHQVVADLEELQAALVCKECKEPVWKNESDRRHFHCKCGKLSA